MHQFPPACRAENLMPQKYTSKSEISRQFRNLWINGSIHIFENSLLTLDIIIIVIINVVYTSEVNILHIITSELSNRWIDF